MPWDSRTRAELAETGLADHADRAEDVGRPIDVRAGAPWWIVWQVLALLLESQEYQLDDLAKQLLPDQASSTFLDRHGAVEGVPRIAATAAVLEIEVSGTPSTTVTFGSATLTGPNGIVYAPSQFADGAGGSVALNVSGKATAYATARTVGTDGNQPALTALDWSAQPANANPQATVTATYAAAIDDELDGPYAQRILARRQERPASGNRADWVAWATEVAGVADAVVYPRLHATYGADTLGSVTLLPLGPAQGDSTTNTRVVSSDLADAVAGYIEGTNDADGGTSDAARLIQKRPVTMRAGDYFVEPAGEQSQDLDVQVTLAAAQAAPFAYSAGDTVMASPAPTTTTFSINGDVTSRYKPGGTPAAILVPVATTAIRGGYYKLTPTTVTYNSGAGRTDFLVPTLPDAAAPGRGVLPGLPNWADIRTAMFALFDQLGPGDTSPASRWPGEESRFRSTLYRSAVAAQLVAQYDDDGALQAGVAGVLNAVVVTPGADVTPPAKTIVTLGILKVRPT